MLKSRSGFKRDEQLRFEDVRQQTNRLIAVWHG
jgi:hypothetical protein